MTKSLGVVARALAEYRKTVRGKTSISIIVFGILATAVVSRLLIVGASGVHPVLNVLLSLSGSLLSVGIVEVCFKIFEGLAHQRNRQEFISFFGEAATRTPYKAVFSKAQIDGVWKYPHDEANEARAQPKGISHAVPFEEVIPIAGLDRLFRLFGKGVEIAADDCEDGKDLPDPGCLSIGLGFNNTTSTLSHYADHLFEIRYVSFAPRDQRLAFASAAEEVRTDDFVINSGDSIVYPKDLISTTKGEDYALFARILHKGLPYVICAGRTAHGTAAALKYLSSSWLTCYQAFIEEGHDLKCTNMVAVLTHIHGKREPRELKPPYFAAARTESGQYTVTP